jgi:NAD(P)-dependent dehydrogenase (short-subunit alcohol dehydrogenase family)
MTTGTATIPTPSVISSLFSVSGKNVLITGGSRGIGLMIAKNFVAAGANVLLTSRSEDACKQAAQEISCPHYVSSNVSNREGCEKLAEHVAKVFDNRLDVLINNAGTSWGEPLERKSGKANWGFDKVFDLVRKFKNEIKLVAYVSDSMVFFASQNVKGMFYLTRACIPLLESAATPEDPARIINVGSVVGLIPQAAPTHAYDASKAAVHNLTKKLAADLAPRSITVNALAPGFVPSRMSEGLGSWGLTEDKISTSIPLKRMGTEEDMAGACLYLSSRAGAWCTGVILNVDGGSVGAVQIELDSSL